MLDVVQMVVSGVVSIGYNIRIPTPAGGSTSLWGFMFGCFVVAFAIKYFLPGAVDVT